MKLHQILYNCILLHYHFVLSIKIITLRSIYFEYLSSVIPLFLENVSTNMSLDVLTAHVSLSLGGVTLNRIVLINQMKLNAVSLYTTALLLIFIIYFWIFLNYKSTI